MPDVPRRGERSGSWHILLAAALRLPDPALAELTIEVEAEPEELQRAFAAVRKGPPPPPPKPKPPVEPRCR